METEKTEEFWKDIKVLLTNSILKDMEQYEQERENWNMNVCREIANGIAHKVIALKTVLKDDE